MEPLPLGGLGGSPPEPAPRRRGWAGRTLPGARRGGGRSRPGERVAGRRRARLLASALGAGRGGEPGPASQLRAGPAPRSSGAGLWGELSGRRRAGEPRSLRSGRAFVPASATGPPPPPRPGGSRRSAAPSEAAVAPRARGPPAPPGAGGRSLPLPLGAAESGAGGRAARGRGRRFLAERSGRGQWCRHGEERDRHGSARRTAAIGSAVAISYGSRRAAAAAREPPCVSGRRAAGGGGGSAGAGGGPGTWGAPLALRRGLPCHPAPWGALPVPAPRAQFWSGSACRWNTRRVCF